MKYFQVVLLMAGLMLGARDLALAAEPKTVNFNVTDIQGIGSIRGRILVAMGVVPWPLLTQATR